MSTQCFPSCRGLKGSLVVHAASHGVTAAEDVPLSLSSFSSFLSIVLSFFSSLVPVVCPFIAALLFLFRLLHPQ